MTTIKILLKSALLQSRYSDETVPVCQNVLMVTKVKPLQKLWTLQNLVKYESLKAKHT